MGGKSAVANLVWQRLGDVRNFVAPTYNGRRELLRVAYEEPFANSLAVMLANPGYDWLHDRWLVDPPPIETVNDADAFISNLWRALQADPHGVAHYADWPVSEADLHSRHGWLVHQGETWFRDRMMADPDFYDVKIAGWWVWGACQWIGSGWCSLDYGRHSGRTRDGGVNQKRPELYSTGKGVHRQSLRGRREDGGTWQARPTLQNRGVGVHSSRILSPQLPSLSGANGRGAYRQETRDGLVAYFEKLALRLRHVRVTCGDWSRVTGRSVTVDNTCARGAGAFTVIFLDPPYSAAAGRQPGLYAVDDLEVAHRVRRWCLEGMKTPDYEGPRYLHPRLRVAICGYQDEHDAEIPDSWERVAWTAGGGYSNQNRAGNDNRRREMIWFSPHCLRPEAEPAPAQLSLLEVLHENDN
jgi:hypothetical protein